MTPEIAKGPSVARRRHVDLGHGFRLASDGVDLWRLQTPFWPEGWVVRSPGDAGRAGLAGTALRVEGRWFELQAVEPGVAGNDGAVFRLTPWNEAEVLRAPVDLGPETCSLLAAERAARTRRAGTARLLGVLSPFVGLLPGEDQRRLEREVGIDAVRTTAISAGTVLLLAVVAGGVGWAARKGLDFGAWQPLARSLAAYWVLFVLWALESVVRLRVAASADEPMGTLPVAGPIVVVRAIIGGAGSSRRPTVRSPDEAWRSARDEVRSLPDGRLEIRSRLPKDHWTLGVTGIAFRGATFRPDSRDVLDDGSAARHRFVLVPVPEDVGVPIHTEYRPEEVRDLYREHFRLRTATWVETVPFVWGLLDEPLQRDLERLYRYEPERWTRFSIVYTVLLGAFNLVAPWLRQNAGPADFLVAVSGIVLLWDAWMRHRALQAEVLRGSVFGFLFAGMARRALRWMPPNDGRPPRGRERPPSEGVPPDGGPEPNHQP